MKVGTVVTWESQAGGYSKVKTGEIVAVVAALEPLASAVNRIEVEKYIGCKFWHSMFLTPPRDEESYIVSVKVGKTEKAKKRLYWPIAGNLKKV